MNRIFIVLSLLIPAGCNTAPPSAQQLAAMSDDELCQVVRDDPLRFSSAAVAADRGLRCHPAVEACDAAGYGPEVPIEARTVCIEAMMTELRQDQEEEAARRAAALNTWMWMNQPGTRANPLVIESR
jgi:hypothetical protein